MTLLELKRSKPYKLHKFDHVLKVYESYWRKIRDRKIKVLEVGVNEGGSLQLWRDYFPKANVYGLDCRLPQTDLGPRIKLIAGDQIVLPQLEGVAKKIGELDVVIDDGSHIGVLSLNTFLAFFPQLTPGGLYFIEDWGTGYWIEWPDGHGIEASGDFVTMGKRMPSHDYGMVGFIKQLVDVCNTLDRTKGRECSTIASMHILPGVVVLRRAK